MEDRGVEIHRILSTVTLEILMMWEVEGAVVLTFLQVREEGWFAL